MHCIFNIFSPVSLSVYTVGFYTKLQVQNKRHLDTVTTSSDKLLWHRFYKVIIKHPKQCCVLCWMCWLYVLLWWEESGLLEHFTLFRLASYDITSRFWFYIQWQLRDKVLLKCPNTFWGHYTIYGIDHNSLTELCSCWRGTVELWPRV